MRAKIPNRGRQKARPIVADQPRGIIHAVRDPRMAPLVLSEFPGPFRQKPLQRSFELARLGVPVEQVADGRARRRYARRPAGDSSEKANGSGHVPSDNESGWPSPLELAALRGVACEFITALLPETEADTAGLPFQFLAPQDVRCWPTTRACSRAARRKVGGIVPGDRTRKANHATPTERHSRHVRRRAQPPRAPIFRCPPCRIPAAIEPCPSASHTTNQAKVVPVLREKPISQRVGRSK